MNSEYYLLSAIGINPKPSKYSLDDLKSDSLSSFSSIALSKLLGKKLDKKPSKVFLLVTKDAKNSSFEEFKKEAEGIDIDVCSIDVPNGISDQEVQIIVQEILKALPENCNLILDATNGLRHFPFLLFISALYLRSFRKITIDGIYYGAWELRKNDQAPFINFNFLLGMMDWYHAVSNFS
ncbi:CRISPR-associated protein, TM1812, partial [mine drainage metagenome]